MLITPSRIAYRGPFGRPGIRQLGGWIIYVGLEQGFRIAVDGGAEGDAYLAILPPFQRHRVATGGRHIVQVLLEAESVDGGCVERMAAAADQRHVIAARIRAAFDQGCTGAADFDRRFFGRDLPPRSLDPRIARAVERIKADPAGRLSAEDCAALAGLSVSRFRHLFRSQIQVTFRRFRAWKRARGLLPMISGCRSLVDVALSAGYADASHFNHSVRQFLGYTPGFIFDESTRGK
jgi:AraC-like DNA-binding protein